MTTIATTTVAVNNNNNNNNNLNSSSNVHNGVGPPNAASSVGSSASSASGNGPRSQDDAMVGYFFQRPQTDPDFENYANAGKPPTRWALGDDSVLEVGGSFFVFCGHL